MLKSKNGFTIVELLIVIVVIAILAAISIVAYNGIQNRASDTSVQNDLRNIANKFEYFRADKGTYPAMAQLSSTELGIKVSKSRYKDDGNTRRNVGFCTTVSPSGNERFVVFAWSTSNNWYSYESNGGLKKQAVGWMPSGGSACPYFGFNLTETGFWHTWLKSGDEPASNDYWMTWLN